MFAGFQTIGKIPELKRRILYTFIMLAVYRVGVFVPTPGIDSQALATFFAQARGTLLGLFDMFSGGALERFSVFALGIMPYISASIILQLLTVVVPYLEKLSKEGELGRKKIIQYTRYGTVLLSLVQSLGISIGLENMTGPGGQLVVPHPGWYFRLMTMITLTSGTAFIMWLGEQITERGIGNGISLIIFVGIVAELPFAVKDEWRHYLMNRGFTKRRIPVQYAKRVVGRRVYGGQKQHLPLRVNTSGVIPPIFASSIILFPATVANFVNVPFVQNLARQFNPGTVLYELLYVGFIIFFCYFYTAVQFNPMDVAENMRKYGGYIPGVRPGKKTAEYIDRILTRITLWGALYLSAVSVLPTLLVVQFNVPFFFGGTSLLIVVGVALDTVQQIEAHMLTRHYEGFMRKVRIKGRRG
ncbi:MAG: preprotein translocase subunit SecY [Deltaproteobacteria bacterium]|nr:preprotein translocase subunit SecY [Deltaproteobacteria bacterium]